MGGLLDLVCVNWPRLPVRRLGFWCMCRCVPICIFSRITLRQLPPGWIGRPTPNHHSRVPVPRQSREDGAGRQRPVCRICRAPSDADLLGNSSWFLRRATGWPPCSASPVTFAVLSIIWNAGPGLVLVENVPKARRPRVPPELSRTARRFPFDANFRRTTPVERYVPELSFNDTKIVTKWAILGRE